MPTRHRRRVPPPTIARANPIELRPRGDFAAWLDSTGGTLAVTTYNSGKVALFSSSDREVIGSYWSFPRPMGLAVAADRMAMATRDHLWTFRTAARANSTDAAVLLLDAVFDTGRLDAHDLAFDRRGLLFANTRFNCAARPSERVNFLASWRPPFMSGVVAGDFCHLNGIGVRDGRLAAATAFCDRATRAAWREGDRFTSGVLIDVRQNAIALRGLCLPHSPRWHAGAWWFCNSGEGTLCVWRPADGAYETVAGLPGFTRGLCFAGGRAVVGLSRIRKQHILDAPPVRQRCRRMHSGISLVDPATCRETGSLEFVRGGREVYDVAFIPRAIGVEFASTPAEQLP